MPGCVRGCVGKAVLLLVLLVGALVAVAVWRPELPSEVARWLRGPGEEPTPEMAERTLDRFERFRSGEGGEEARMGLSGAEITSVLRFALPGLLPAGVGDPTVRIEDGRITVEARMAREAFPRLPDLGPVTGALPDTVPITVEATLVPAGRERAHLVVHSVEVARIPVPDRLIPQVLSAFGRGERAGRPADALPVPLPAGVSSVVLARDSLVLVADP